MPIEDFGGLKLHTQTVGASGPPVVLLHGLLIGSLAAWYFAVAPELARDRRVLMYDLRGHGMSPVAHGSYGLRAQTRDLGRVVDRFAPDVPVSLVGHSAGGAIALRYALDHPDKVARVVVVDTLLPLMAASWIDQVKKGSREGLLGLLPITQKDSVERGGRQGRRLLAQVFTLATRTTLLDDLLAEPDISDADLAALHVPLLLCYASRTDPVITATRDRLSALVAGARVTIIEGGHFLPAESPGPLTAAIREFLDA
jgi:pimeloyl-ACP methyl ester carboxylesterase